jgi:nucleoside-triphosphatase THEP1
VHIIVTGDIGIGKSTVCRRVIDMCSGKNYICGGVLTFKNPSGDIIIEDILKGNRMAFASLVPVFNGPRIGKYYFNPAGLAFGESILESQAGSPVFIVDELGPLELESKGFSRAVALVNSKKTGACITVVRKSLLPFFLPMFTGTPAIYEVTLKNRDFVPGRILRRLSRYENPE